MNKQKKTLSAPKPTFTPLQKGLLQPTCACGGSAGIDGFCDECRDRKFTSPDAASAGRDHSQRNPFLMQPETYVVEHATLPDIGIASGPFSGHNFSRVHVHAAGLETIQTKQMINQPANPYEQEAERVAEQVSSTASITSGDGTLEANEASLHQKERQSAPSSASTRGVPSIVQDVLRSPGQSLDAAIVSPGIHEALRSPGQPLDPDIRTVMEARFGHSFDRVTIRPGGQAIPSTLTVNRLGDHHEQEANRVSHRIMQAPRQASMHQSDTRAGYDFSNVRIHTDAQADASTRAINARAYTFGPHIVFRSDHYSPNTLEGQRLLSHELAHVLQQSNANRMTHTEPRVQRTPDSGEDESWYEKLKHKAASLKTRAYKAIIEKMRHGKEEEIKRMRQLAATLSPKAQKAVNAIIDVYDDVYDTTIRLALAIIGLVVGFVSGIIALIEAIIKLILGIFKFFGLLIGGIFSKRFRNDFEDYVHQIKAAVSNIPAGIRRVVKNWRDKYEKASPEEQALMGGELVGQIEAVIATAGVAAAKAGQATSITGGGARLVLAPAEGVLQEAPIVVTATAPVATSIIAATVPKAGLLGGGQLMMEGAEQGGRSKTRTKPKKLPEDFPEEAERRLSEIEKGSGKSSQEPSRGPAKATTTPTFHVDEVVAEAMKRLKQKGISGGLSPREYGTRLHSEISKIILEQTGKVPKAWTVTTEKYLKDFVKIAPENVNLTVEEYLTKYGLKERYAAFSKEFLETPINKLKPDLIVQGSDGSTLVWDITSKLDPSHFGKTQFYAMVIGQESGGIFRVAETFWRVFKGI